MPEWQHPELREGEVYIGNFEGSELDDNPFRHSFPSERLGMVAYYFDGPQINTPIPEMCELRPWFALKSEVDASGLLKKKS